jgi:uncharacterized membrane protein SpoIIM required for sporulation
MVKLDLRLIAKPTSSITTNTVFLVLSLHLAIAMKSTIKIKEKSPLQEKQLSMTLCQKVILLTIYYLILFFMIMGFKGQIFIMSTKEDEYYYTQKFSSIKFPTNVTTNIEENMNHFLKQSQNIFVRTAFLLKICCIL